MSQKLACFTLFDITQTGVLNRARPNTDIDIKSWIYKRNTQCNFDTILQAISLRSQPDIINFPKKIDINFKDSKFGSLYKDMGVCPCWTFDFEVQHPSVFEDSIAELGFLYSDCQGIPMIKVGTELDQIPEFLDTSKELRNIYFVKYESEY